MRKEEMDLKVMTQLRVEVIRTRLARLKDSRWLKKEDETPPAEVRRAQALVRRWEAKQSVKAIKRRRIVDDAIRRVSEELAFGRLDAALKLLKKFEAKF